MARLLGWRHGAFFCTMLFLINTKQLQNHHRPTMASQYLLICIVFASTIYLTIAFLHGPSHLSPHRRITSDVHNTHLRSLSVSTDEDSHQLDDVHPHDRGNKVRFRSRVAYCGTPFCGWQLQPHRTTIQGEIEEALYRRYNRRIAVVGAGRTDAGVHARGQAIHFDLFQEE
eukprot:scaffold41104_cov234-Skeletonema_marinoi.AAC.2